MHNWSATAFYYNEFAQLIGHDAQQVNDWLDAHPDYDGYLWMNYGDGGEDVNVTDIFRRADEAAPAKLDATLEGMAAA